MIRLLLVAVLAWAAPALAIEISPPSPIPPHTAVVIEVEEGADVWVLDTNFRSVEVFALKAGGYVFVAPPGEYAILGTEGETRFLRRVRVTGSVPPPPDPDPPNPPDPDPEPPQPPAPVPNALGLGQIAYDAARALERPQEVETMAATFLHQAALLNQRRTTPAEAQRAIREARAQLGAHWEPVAVQLEGALAVAVQTHGSSLTTWRDFFVEIGEALELVK